MLGLAAVAVVAPASAQQGPIEVAFELPLNLTRLASHIPKVRVQCELRSNAIIESLSVPGSQALRRVVEVEIPVTQGEVVQTTRLVITLQPQELNNPSGKSATYECLLRAFDSPHQVWTYFGGYGSGTASSTVILTPAPAAITGTFVW